MFLKYEEVATIALKIFILAVELNTFSDV